MENQENLESWETIDRFLQPRLSRHIQQSPKQNEYIDEAANFYQHMNYMFWFPKARMLSKLLLSQYRYLC